MRIIALDADLPADAVVRRRAALFSELPEALFLFDRSLRLVDSNGVGHRWLGVPPEEDLLGRVHPHDAALLVAARAYVAEDSLGWSAPVPLRVRAADGSYRTWSVTADNLLDHPDVEAVVVRARDVTGSWAAGVEPDALLREVLAVAPVCVIATDKDSRVRFAGGAALTVPPERMVGRHLADFAETPEQAARIRAAGTQPDATVISDWGGRSWSARWLPVVREGELDGAVGVFTDVSELMRAQRALESSEANVRGVLEAVQEALVVLDVEGCITTCNVRFRMLFGPSAHPGCDVRELVGHDTARLLLEPSDRSGGVRHEVRLRDRDGESRWVLLSVSPLRASDGERLGSVAVLTDITPHKDAERRLRVAAQTDAVTGVGSRAMLSDRLERALGRRTGVVAVLFCDVDHLKVVNDTHGHVVGDVLLREVASRIRTALRPSDSITRYGGDEFVVVADSLPDTEEADLLAERVRAAVDQPFELSTGAVLRPSLSIGIATAPPEQDGGGLLAAADAAVYVAKQSGRNTVRRHPDR